MPIERHATLEDLVLGDELLQRVARVEDDLHGVAALVDPSPRQVVLEPADAVEVGMEPTAGRGLDEVEHVLAVAESVERRRERTDLEAHLAEEEDERRDAGQLGEDGPDVLRARRGLDAHEQFGPVHERDLVGEARQPVDPVDERRDLRVRAELGELLVAAVHVADDGVGRDDAFAVEADDEPQRAVRSRMLGAEVEDHVAGVELDVHLRVGQVTPRLPVDGEVDAHDSSWAASSAAPSPLSASADSPASAGWATSATSSWAPSGASSSGMASTSTRPGHGFTIRASSG